MAAKNYKIQIEQGATFQLHLSLKDVNQNALDLTGWTGKCQLRSRPEAPTFIDVPVTILTPATIGVVQLNLTSDQTAAIPVNPTRGATIYPTPYVYSIDLVKPTGEVYRIMQGIAEVSPEVTR